MSISKREAILHRRIRKLRAQRAVLRKAAERLLNYVCSTESGWIAENEDVIGPLRRELAR